MTHYEVFRECFPELKLTEEHYDKLSEEKLCRAFGASGRLRAGEGKRAPDAVRASAKAR